KGLNDSENPGPAVDMRNPLNVDPMIRKLTTGRGKSDTMNLIGTRSEKEREIYRKLDGPITSLDYKDTPLKTVLDDLANTSVLNIVADKPALKDANISLDQPITMRLDGVSLKSALNLLLHQAHLTYQVQNDVLNITTEENARGKM